MSQKGFYSMMLRHLAMLFIIFSLFGNNSINCIKFFFKMTPNSNKCLGEYLTSNTVGNQIEFYIYEL